MRRIIFFALAGCGSPEAALFSQLPDAEVGGCLDAHFGALVEDTQHLMLVGRIPLDPSQERTEPYAPGELFEATVGVDATLRAEIGDDLTQNWPCNHLPFEADSTGDGLSGTLALTVLRVDDVPAAGGRVLFADVEVRDAVIEMDSGARHELPDLMYSSVAFGLDVE